MDIFAVIILGALVGVVSAFLGIGGGALIVPILPLFVPGLSQQQVIATSLATILLVVTNNSIHFHRQKIIHWPVVFIMGPMTAATSYLAGQWALTTSETVLKVIMSVVLFLMAVRTFFLVLEPVLEKAKLVLTLKAKLSFWGLVAGAISGVTGIGSGTIFGAVLLGYKVMPNNNLSPTSNAIMIFTTLSAAMAYAGDLSTFGQSWTFGEIHLDYVLILFLAAVASSWVARKYQTHMKERLRKTILGSLLLLLSVKVFISIF